MKLICMVNCSKALLVGVLFFAALSSSAQNYVVYFPPKDISTLQDVYDTPIQSKWLNRVEELNAEELKVSKWLNAAWVKAPQKDIYQLQSDGFTVSEVSQVHQEVLASEGGELVVNAAEEVNTNILSVKGDFLHDKGLSGKGVKVAILDAGYTSMNELSFYQDLKDNNQIIEEWNYVLDQENIFVSSNHGTSVFSIVVGSNEQNLEGSGDGAYYYLYVTEDASAEHLGEEFNWAIAAEHAAELGVQIINSSLSYTTFDTTEHSHSYADLTGRKTVISRAAAIASEKGILVISAAGNYGNKGWQYIGAPADADSVLTIGSIDSTGVRSAFSSKGPTADGRIKPDVMAMGQRTYYITTSGLLAQGNGTSFSAPVISGLSACLWQAFPEASSHNIRKAIKTTASQYNNPDTLFGFGIANFRAAYDTLKVWYPNAVIESDNVYPNPFTDEINLTIGQIQNLDKVELYNVKGRKVFSYSPSDELVGVEMNPISLPQRLKTGAYVLKVFKRDGKVEVNTIQKVNKP